MTAPRINLSFSPDDTGLPGGSAGGVDVPPQLRPRDDREMIEQYETALQTVAPWLLLFIAILAGLVLADQLYVGMHDYNETRLEELR